MIIDKISEHPLKDILVRKHGLTNAMLARYMELSYSYVSGIMNGRYTVKPEYQAKLQNLADEMEKKNEK